MNEGKDPLENASKTFLDFVVVGAQKAGSTFIMQCLQDHPCIYMPRGETPFFQDPDYDEQRLDVLEKSVRKAFPSQKRGIKRPSYLGQAEVPERIAKHFPDAKIIAVLRNPISRAISAYFHLLKYRHIPAVPVNDGLRAILSGRWEREYPLSSSILTYGLYNQHLERYTQFFNESQIKIIVFDDIGREPVRVARELYMFLNVDSDVRPVRAKDRPMSATYSMNRLRINRFLNSLIFQRSSDHSRIYPRKGSRLTEKVCNGIDKLILKSLFPANKPGLNPIVFRELQDYYSRDTECLRERLGHSLSGW